MIGRLVWQVLSNDQICSSLGATYLAGQFQYAVCYIMEHILELPLKYCGLFFGLEFEFYWICYVTQEVNFYYILNL